MQRGDEAAHPVASRRGSDGEDDQQTPLRDDTRQATDEADRGRVGPLQIVDDEDDRIGRAELVEQGEQPLADPELRGGGVTVVAAGVEPGDDVRPTWIVRILPDSQCIEQRTEQSPLVEFVGGRRVERDTKAADGDVEGLEEVRLADPDLPGDDRHRASPLDGAPGGVDERGQLGEATDHLWSVGRLVRSE